jgi:hypothetical protein
MAEEAREHVAMLRLAGYAFIALLIIGWFAACFLLRDVEYGLLGLSLVAIAYYFLIQGSNRVYDYFEQRQNRPG